jgi:hypothetical protein
MSRQWVTLRGGLLNGHRIEIWDQTNLYTARVVSYRRLNDDTFIACDTPVAIGDDVWQGKQLPVKREERDD